ncbi:MAG: hypothetical protein MI785_07295 [Kiloniellales bacterium]|nr:hypothetical protein [Kiloniellales bacterium]
MSSSPGRKPGARKPGIRASAAGLVLALSTSLAAAPLLADVQGANIQGADLQKARVQQEGAMTEKSIESVLDAHAPALMAHPEVVGTGVGLCDDSPCIKVFVIARSAELRQRIGAEIEGYRVDLVETGPIRALEPK